MNQLLVIIYYVFVIVALFLYIMRRKKGLNISDFLVLGITILFSIAGVFISYGIPYGFVELNESLYIQYLAFAICVPLGLVMGLHIKPKKIKQYSTDVSDTTLYITIVIILIYAIGFFLIIHDSIPLVMLLQGKETAAYRVARLRVTHNLSSHYNTFFIYSYNGLVFRYISVYVFSILFIKYLNNPPKYKKIFWSYFIAEFFMLFYATEKAPLIYLLLVIIYDLYMVKLKGYIIRTEKNISAITDKLKRKSAKRQLKLLIICGGCIFLILYILFMGIEDINKGFMSFLSRVFVSQSSATYLMMNILNTSFNGCLYGKGIPLVLIDNLLNRETVNLSESVYSQMFSNYTELGGAGTAGSIAIFEYYANFGLIIAIIIVLVVSIVVGYVDNKSSITIEYAQSKELPIATGSMFLMLFFQGYLGHFQTFFMLPFIVAPQMMIVLIMRWFFEKVKINLRRK